MRKCLPLNLLKPTRTKEKLLIETYRVFFSLVREALGYVADVESRDELYNKTYDRFRGMYGVVSQLIIEATSYAWSIRKTIDCDTQRCVKCGYEADRDRIASLNIALRMASKVGIHKAFLGAKFLRGVHPSAGTP